MYIAKQSHSDKPFTCGNAGFSQNRIIVVYSSIYIRYRCIFWHGRLQVCAHTKSNTHNYIMLSRLCGKIINSTHILLNTFSYQKSRDYYKSTYNLHMRKSQPYSRNLHTISIYVREMCMSSAYTKSTQKIHIVFTYTFVKRLRQIYIENPYSLHNCICQVPTQKKHN